VTGNGSETRAVLDRLASGFPDWASEDGPKSSVVLTSRVRLARNLASLPFPGRADREAQRQVVARFRRAVQGVAELSRGSFLDCGELEEPDLEFLVERRLASRDLVRGNRQRGVLVAPGEGLTVMVNEEDHLRLQSMLSGLRLGEAFDRVDAVDDVLDAGLDYAFDPELGYLTACPTNLGTGMRASVLAHLPALVLTRRAKKVVEGVTAMGMAVRGYYGEGTEIMGNFFQISNQTTLGRGENEIISRLDEVVRRILGYEDEAREAIRRAARLQIEDKIYRAFGTLRSARTIRADEVVSLASAVRFGIVLELPDLCPLTALNEVLLLSQPGHVVRRAGMELDDDDRRRVRADLIRARLHGNGELGTGKSGIGENPSRGEGTKE
jgi:protein arginine kinase